MIVHKLVQFASVNEQDGQFSIDMVSPLQKDKMTVAVIAHKINEEQCEEEIKVSENWEKVNCKYCRFTFWMLEQVEKGFVDPDATTEIHCVQYNPDELI